MPLIAEFNSFKVIIDRHSVCVNHSVMSNSLRPHGLYIAYQASPPWNSPDKNTGVGCHFLLLGIFPTLVGNQADSFFTVCPTREAHIKFKAGQKNQIHDSVQTYIFRFHHLYITGIFYV